MNYDYFEDGRVTISLKKYNELMAKLDELKEIEAKVWTLGEFERCFLHAIEFDAKSLPTQIDITQRLNSTNFPIKFSSAIVMRSKDIRIDSYSTRITLIIDK